MMTEIRCPVNVRRNDANSVARIVECASLRNLDLFRHLSPVDLQRVAEFASFHRVERRKPIATPGADADYLCLLTQGLAKATRIDANGTETLLYLMKSGELFGGHVWDARTDMSVVAMQPCVTASIRIRDLERIMGAPVLVAEIDRVRAMRLQQMEDRLTEMNTGRVAARAARTVLRLCREFPAQLACGTKVNVLFTQQDIASMIGATREVTSSTLNDFRRAGWMGVHERYMCVHDAHGLHEKSLCKTA